MAANFKSAMIRFNHATSLDLDYYEYKIYLASDLTETALKPTASTVDATNISGLSKSNLIVISDLDNTSQIGNEIPIEVAYKAKVRVVNTGGVAGPWSSASASATTELIEDQFVKELTAAKITAGTIGAHEIILTQSGSQTSYSPPNGTAVIRSSDYVQGSAGWIIRGDGTAEFGSASIRGVLAAKSIFIDQYNRWGRNSGNTADETNVFVAGKDDEHKIYWDGNNLTIKGGLVTGNTISGGTVGGVGIGSNKIYLGDGTYNDSNTPFYVDTSNQFSLGTALTFSAGVLSIGGTSASTVVNGAASGATAVQPSGVNANVTSISGGVITTGTINLNNVVINNAASGARITLDSTGLKAYNSGGTNTVAINSDGSASFSGTVTGSTIVGSTFNSSNNLFKVDGSGNLFANNIYATGNSSDFGLQIRADGNGGSTSGAIWILSALNYNTKVGNSEGALNIRYRKNDPSGIADAVILQPAYISSGTTWSQNRHFEINMASGYNFYINSDIVLRGSGLDGTEPSNDFFSDNPVDVGSSSGWPARWISTSSKGDYVIGIGTSTQANKENIFPVTGIQALDVLKKLKLKQFTYKKNRYDDDTSYLMKQLDIDYGFMAEDVAQEIPSLAVYGFTKSGKQRMRSEDFSYEDLNNPEYVKPAQWKNNAVLSLLVGAVQVLNERIEFLESQLAVQ